MYKTKQVALVSLFGVIVFVSKIVLPTPFDKMFVVVQALLLALGSLLLGKIGATIVGFIGGFLTAFWRFTFFPFSLIFAVLYGALIDVSFHIFKIREHLENGESKRIILILTLSSAVIGILTMYSMMTLGLMPRMPTLYLMIITVGVANGMIAAHLASFIWNKSLRDYAHMFSNSSESNSNPSTTQ